MNLIANCLHGFYVSARHFSPLSSILFTFAPWMSIDPKYIMHLRIQAVMSCEKDFLGLVALRVCHEYAKVHSEDVLELVPYKY